MSFVDGPQFYEGKWVRDGDVWLLLSKRGRVMGFKRDNFEQALAESLEKNKEILEELAKR